MFQEVIRHEIARDALDYVLDSTSPGYIPESALRVWRNDAEDPEGGPATILRTEEMMMMMAGMRTSLCRACSSAGIRQRDALPVHETEMPEMCLPLRKRPRRTTPGPGYEVGESSTAGTARQVGPTTAEADLYGFTDLFRAAPDAGCSREFRLWFWDNGMTLLEPPRDCTDHPRGGQPESY
ncbi:hypothetical protein Tco_0557908 [Tanacetum coccineum]